MAAISTTYNYSILESPAGHRMVMQTGRAQFLAGGCTARINAAFNFLKAALVTPEKPKVTAGKSVAILVKYIPYVTATQFTTSGLPVDRKVVVSRLTGVTASGQIFHYMFIGY